MRTKLKTILCLMLAMVCVASFSITAFASDGGEATTAPDVETTTDPTTETETPVTDEVEVDFEIPFNYTIDNDGNLIITIDGVADPAEITTIGTVVTNGGRLNLRTGAGLDFEIIDQLRPGEEVTVIGSEGDWYEVIVPEKKGYVHGDYLELIEKAEQNSELDLAMLIHLMGMMFDGSEGFGNIFEGIFEGFFGAETDTTEDGKPPFAFTPDGNMTLIDDFLQIEVPGDEETEQVEKQFITVQSKNGNTFYIVIDRNGETENVYFLNLVDEADLMALMESEEGETEAPTCSCTDKCVIGAINTNCEICRTNMSECTGKEPVVEPEPEQPTEPVEEPDEKKSANFLPLIIVLIAGAGGFAVYWFKFRKPKAKTSGNTDLDDYDFGEDDEGYDEETELDDADVMAEAESEDEDA